jgi:hypothetical protein
LSAIPGRGGACFTISTTRPPRLDRSEEIEWSKEKSKNTKKREVCKVSVRVAVYFFYDVMTTVITV